MPCERCPCRNTLVSRFRDLGWPLLPSPTPPGPDSRLTMHASENVASQLDDDGRYLEAEVVAKETLARQARVLGAEHSETLHTAELLAGIESRLGKTAEALARYTTTLEALARTLGGEHSLTLQCSANMAVRLYVAGRMREAARLFERVTVVRQRVLGNAHPKTANVAMKWDACLGDAAKPPALLRVLRALLQRNGATA